MSAACGAKRPGFEQRPDWGRWSIPCVLEDGHDGPHESALGDQFERPQPPRVGTSAGNWTLHTATATGIRVWVDTETGEYRVFGAENATDTEWAAFLAVLRGVTPLHRGRAMTADEIAAAILSDMATLDGGSPAGGPREEAA